MPRSRSTATSSRAPERRNRTRHLRRRRPRSSASTRVPLPRFFEQHLGAVSPAAVRRGETYRSSTLRRVTETGSRPGLRRVEVEPPQSAEFEGASGSRLQDLLRTCAFPEIHTGPHRGMPVPRSCSCPVGVVFAGPGSRRRTLRSTLLTPLAR